MHSNFPNTAAIHSYRGVKHRSMKMSPGTTVNSDCIIVFLKYPEPGRVKTRLAADIGADVAVELYRRFVADTLATVDGLDVTVRIHFSPCDAAGLVRDWLGPDYDLTPQQGIDLGERMKVAFSAGFDEGFTRAVIIGSDSPDIPPHLYHQAFDALDSSEAVIGPATDGGYYLLGFRDSTFTPGVFDGVAWSSDRVFAETLTHLTSAGRTVHRLPEWRDIDCIDDLHALARTIGDSDGSDGAAPLTRAYVRTLDMNPT
jgi:uncharacterized protein